MEFRGALTTLRQAWQQGLSGLDSPADGFFLTSELRVPRYRARYDPALVQMYQQAIQEIVQSVRQPITYAGPANQKVFSRPSRLRTMPQAVSIPGTHPEDFCLLIDSDLWRTFHKLSLWIEALCIHEWCLFSEQVQQTDVVGRGFVYTLLTTRPGNRRPLSWERNQVDLLLMEGHIFTCPWTDRRIHQPSDYSLDHLLPVTVYPINEMWNLVPADPEFNSHQKRDRLPSPERLLRAQQPLLDAYRHYEASEGLNLALHEDVSLRFASVTGDDFPKSVTEAVLSFLASIADARNVARF